MKTHTENGVFWIQTPKWWPWKRRQKKAPCKQQKRGLEWIQWPLSRHTHVIVECSKMDPNSQLVLVSFMANLLALYEVYVILFFLLKLEHERTKLMWAQYLDSTIQLVMRRPLHHRGRRRHYWIKPGRTCSWWDNFLTTWRSRGFLQITF